MRVWLVDDRAGGEPSALENALRQLETRPGVDCRLLGVSTIQQDFAESMRKLVPDLVDVLVIHERALPNGPQFGEVLGLGVGAVVATRLERFNRVQELALEYPVTFLPADAGCEQLWL